MSKTKVSRLLKTLFWEYDRESLRENLSSPHVIARVLELGDEKQFREFERAVGGAAIRKFLRTKGAKLLTPRSYNFWKLYYKTNGAAKKS